MGKPLANEAFYAMDPVEASDAFTVQLLTPEPFRMLEALDIIVSEPLERL